MDENVSSLTIQLSRINRLYYANEHVDGHIVVKAKKGWSHTGVKLRALGQVNFSMSGRKPGLVDIYTNDTVPPTILLKEDLELEPPGSFPEGTTKIPFQFPLSTPMNMLLLETYHGVHIAVTYTITVTCERGFGKRTLDSSLEFVVSCPNTSASDKLKASVPSQLHITKETFIRNLDNNDKNGINSGDRNVTSITGVSRTISDNPSNLGNFTIKGKFHQNVYSLNAPLTGEFALIDSEKPIKSVELRLERMESINAGHHSKTVRTEIQNIQVAAGDMCRNVTVPLYMILPRLYTCPTYKGPSFSIEFLISIVIVFAHDYVASETYALDLVRDSK